MNRPTDHLPRPELARTATVRCAWLAPVVVACVVASAPAQVTAERSGDGAFALTTVDGAFRSGMPAAIDAAKRALLWREATAKPGSKELTAISLEEIVALHGAAPRVHTVDPIVRLVGGDELRGELVGGDAGGETFLVRSSALGVRTVRIDRLQSIVFPAVAGTESDAALVVPADAREDEALFWRAKRGFDVALGQIHRFRDDAILFEARGDDGPRARPFAGLAGCAVRGGEDRDQPATSTLLSIAGDRLGVAWQDLDEGGFGFVDEDGGELRLPRGAVSCLASLAPGIHYVADLTPASVEERSYFDDGTAPLHPHRVDRSVVGGALRCGGFGFAKGIGVQSRCVLRYVVPDDVAALVGLVGIDDAAFDLPVRAGVVVRVVVGEVVAFERTLRAGDGPLPLGRVAVRPGGTVRLEVDFGPGLDLGDRVDWLDVAFVR